MAHLIPCPVWVEFPPEQLVLRPIKPLSCPLHHGRRSPSATVPISRWCEKSFPVVLVSLESPAEPAQRGTIPARPIASKIGWLSESAYGSKSARTLSLVCSLSTNSDRKSTRLNSSHIT